MLIRALESFFIYQNKPLLKYIKHLFYPHFVLLADKKMEVEWPNYDRHKDA